MSDVNTRWHLQDSPEEGWVTIATAPTSMWPNQDALVAYANRIKDNVHTQDRTYDGGHRIITVTTSTTWIGTHDNQWDYYA